MQKDASDTTKTPQNQKLVIGLISKTFMFGTIVALGLVGYTKCNQWQFQTKTEITQSQLQHEKQLSALNSQLTEQINELKNKIQKKEPDQSLLIKARYTLELAEINAYWTTDYDTTISLLKKADELLATEKNPSFFTVREIIAQEIAEQEAAPKFDMIGLLSQLNAVELQIKASKNTSQTPTEKSIPSETISTAKDLLQRLVIIRHHEQPIEPLQSPAYKASLQEATLLNIQEAKWAVIQTNDEIYQMALDEAIEQEKQMGSDTVIISSLEALKNIQLKHPHIVPKQSLNLLKEAMDASTGETQP